jgi:hypothetical protein
MKLNIREGFKSKLKKKKIELNNKKRLFIFLFIDYKNLKNTNLNK